MPHTANTIIETTETHFFPVFTRTELVVQKALGSRVWDVDGREYIDLTSGWGVTCLGHCPPELTQALTAQLHTCMQTPNSNLSYTRAQADAAWHLVEIAPEGLTRVFFTNCGSEATEGAIKLVRRATGKAGIVACHGGFHGRTLGAASITSGEKYRVPFAPLMPGARFVNFGDVEAMAQAIDDTIGAIIVEPIQGEGGVNVPPDGYLRELRQLADDHNVLLIFDEIQTGLGRTGQLFAADHDSVTPDIMLLGKCLGGGFPVGAILIREAVASTIQKGDHGGTYSGNPLACAAVSAVVQAVSQPSLLEHCRQAGQAIFDFLHSLQRQYPAAIREVRGKGMLAGCELACDALAVNVMNDCLRKGIIVNVTHGNVLRLFPALNIELDLLQQGLGVVQDVLKQLA